MERRKNDSSRVVLKALEKDGWVLIRQKGSHAIYQKNGKKPVPIHKADIPKGTLSNIVKITGIKF